MQNAPLIAVVLCAYSLSVACAGETSVIDDPGTLRVEGMSLISEQQSRMRNVVRPHHLSVMVSPDRWPDSIRALKPVSVSVMLPHNQLWIYLRDQSADDIAGFIVTTDDTHELLFDVGDSWTERRFMKLRRLFDGIYQFKGILEE